MQVTRLYSPNRTKVKRRTIDLIVIHDMEAPELDGTAEAVARYFQRTDVRASAHECIDANSVVVTCPDRDVAWAAPGANHNGLQFELAGYARQTRREWLDAYGQAMLKLAARRVAKKCLRYNLPVVFRDAEAIKAGKQGITTHWEVTKAYRRSSHTDPGPNFPLNTFVAAVKEQMRAVDHSDILEAFRGQQQHPHQVKIVQKALGMRVQSGRWGRWTRRAWKRRFGPGDPGFGDLRTLGQEAGFPVYR